MPSLPSCFTLWAVSEASFTFNTVTAANSHANVLDVGIVMSALVPLALCAWRVARKRPYPIDDARLLSSLFVKATLPSLSALNLVFVLALLVGADMESWWVLPWTMASIAVGFAECALLAKGADVKVGPYTESIRGFLGMRKPV